MANSVSPHSGSLLLTQAEFPIAFTYDPATPGSLVIDVHWGTDDTHLQFQSPCTTTDPVTGVANNVLYYDGPTPATQPTITLTNKVTGDVLLTFRYVFKHVVFLNDGVSMPTGIQNVWPSQDSPPPDPRVHGLELCITAVDPDNSNAPVQGLVASFSSANNALKYYQAIAPYDAIPPQPGDGTGTLRYFVPTDINGVATVFAMPTSPGIFSFGVRIGSSGAWIARLVGGRVVYLFEQAPPYTELLDPLEFPTEDTVNQSIPLDDTDGPTFPTAAPSTILATHGGPVGPGDSAVICTFTDPETQSQGLMVGDIMLASDLVQGAGIAKSRAAINNVKSNYFYLTSNGVSAYQSSIVKLTATGTPVSGPDPSAVRNNAMPDYAGTVLNSSTITGGVLLKLSLFTLFGLSNNDKYTINVYTNGYNGNTAQVRTDFHARTFTMNGTGAQAQLLPQEWFVGYGHNQARLGTAQFEVIGHPASGDFYSKILTLTLDTTAG